MPDKSRISEEYKNIQDLICQQIEETDGEGKFQEDIWERPGGGGGRTRIIQNGAILEKAGVNYSAVHGILPPSVAKSFGVDSSGFFASGVSIVMHPYHPLVPIIHMNIRYFEMDNGEYWFGGGIDLTPHYVDREQAVYFHNSLKEVCDKYHPDFYPEFKQRADEYFYIPHREETRGIGGIFYDHLKETQEYSKQDILNFSVDLGKLFPQVYAHLINLNRDKPFSPQQQQWQMLRRGRYVEFNLVYDRGTKFGLQTSGRVESILMSLPQNASWQYNHSPKPGSAEAETLEYLKKGIDWTNLTEK